MKKTIFSIAEITVQVTHTYEYLSLLCADYLSKKDPEIEIVISQEDIEAERVGPASLSQDGYLESLAFYRKFCEMVSNRGIFLFHCCALEVEGKAYLFTANSGTGKSTHGRLWMEAFGEKVKVLNGDKPLIKQKNGKMYIFGTPFTGKERWGYNGSAPIAGVCFIRRSEKNSIERITSTQGMIKAYSQTLIPSDPESASVIIKELTYLLESVPLYSLGCNISLDAAKLSFTTMTGEKT